MSLADELEESLAAEIFGGEEQRRRWAAGGGDVIAGVGAFGRGHHGGLH